jgi:hypothetical protein
MRIVLRKSGERVPLRVINKVQYFEPLGEYCLYTTTDQDGVQKVSESEYDFIEVFDE